MRSSSPRSGRHSARQRPRQRSWQGFWQGSRASFQRHAGRRHGRHAGQRRPSSRKTASSGRPAPRLDLPQARGRTGEALHGGNAHRQRPRLLPQGQDGARVLRPRARRGHPPDACPVPGTRGARQGRRKLPRPQRAGEGAPDAGQAAGRPGSGAGLGRRHPAGGGSGLPALPGLPAPGHSRASGARPLGAGCGPLGSRHRTGSRTRSPWPWTNLAPARPASAGN